MAMITLHELAAQRRAELAAARQTEQASLATEKAERERAVVKAWQAEISRHLDVSFTGVDVAAEEINGNGIENNGLPLAVVYRVHIVTTDGTIAYRPLVWLDEDGDIQGCDARFWRGKALWLSCIHRSGEYRYCERLNDALVWLEDRAGISVQSSELTDAD